MNRRIVTGGLVAGVVAVLCWQVINARQEPRFEGKTLSQWISRYITEDLHGGVEARQLHGNALPGHGDAHSLEWMPVGFAPTGAQHWVTLQEITQAKARLHSLRPNMTDDQVFAALGLLRCYAFANGHGPRERFSLSYDMLNGHALEIVRDCAASPTVKLISVSLDAAIWKQHETVSH